MKRELPNLLALDPDAPVAEVAMALDRDVPGWESLVDLDKLDMESGCACIAGQVFARLQSAGRGSGYSRINSYRRRRLGESTVIRAFGADQRWRRYWKQAILARRKRAAA